MLLFLAVALVAQVAGHARIADPPQRGSLWRHPEYAWSNPGKPIDDTANQCGGKDVTDQNNGACGLCGDSIHDPMPRTHEIGGLYDRGIIVRNYAQGQTINVVIDITAGHRPGWLEFRLCPYSVVGAETQECFDRYLLASLTGQTRFDINFQYQLNLPAGVTCERCVLQWHWHAEGNRQYYRNCADISIN